MSEPDNYSGGAVALTTFASVMLMIAGAFQFFAGWPPSSMTTRCWSTEDYVISLDTTAWGWIHLLMGSSCSSRACPCSRVRFGPARWQ